jgi:microcystin-dependent protein
MDPTLAEIRIFAGNFAPRSWAFCDGQLMSIAENTALFSLLGTTYGGDGQVTFGIPDFRGRIPVGTGQGGSIASVDLGEMAGNPTVTLISSQNAMHNHAGAMGVSTSPGNSSAAQADVLAVAATNTFADGPAGIRTGGTVNVAIAGGNLPHNNMMPSLALNYIIAVEGIYPSRN